MASLRGYRVSVWVVEATTHSTTAVSDEMVDFLESLNIRETAHFTRVDQFGETHTYSVRKKDLNQASQKNLKTGMIRQLKRYEAERSTPRLPALRLISSIPIKEIGSMWKFETDTHGLYRSVSEEMNNVLTRLNIGRGCRSKNYWLHKTGLMNAVQTNMETGKRRMLISTDSGRMMTTTAAMKSGSDGSLSKMMSDLTISTAVTTMVWQFKDDSGQFQSMPAKMSEFLTGMSVATTQRYRTDEGTTYTLSKYSRTHGSQLNEQSGKERDIRAVKLASVASTISSMLERSESSELRSPRVITSKKKLIWQFLNDSDMFIRVHKDMNRFINGLSIGTSSCYRTMIGTQTVTYKVSKLAHNCATQENTSTGKSRLLRAIFVDRSTGDFISVVS